MAYQQRKRNIEQKRMEAFAVVGIFKKSAPGNTAVSTLLEFF